MGRATRDPSSLSGQAAMSFAALNPSYGLDRVGDCRALIAMKLRDTIRYAIIDVCEIFFQNRLTMALVRNIPAWMQASTVRVGQVWIQSRNVEQCLARYAKLIFCTTGSNDHPYSLVGSSTAIRYGKQCLLFCCQHQIQQFRPDEITIPVDKSGKILISGSQFLWIERDDKNKDEDFRDLCAMIYDTENYGEPNLEFSFFGLTEKECWKGDTAAQFYLFGYPTSLRNVDYEIPHISVKQVVVSAVYSGRSHSLGLHRIEMTRTAEFSSDGLSGGPVFHISKDQKGFYAGLAGIVIRGSDTSNFLHFIDARLVFSFLEKLRSA
jgi:hypothetical protein